MVDFKAMSSPQAAIAVLLAMNDQSRGRFLNGLRGLGSSAVIELDSFLAGIADAAPSVQGGDSVARRVASVRQQIKPLRYTTVRTPNGTRRATIYNRQGMNGLGSWFSEILNGATDIIGKVGPVVAPIIGAATGNPLLAVPGFFGGQAGQPQVQQQPAYAQSWYARNDPTSGAAALAPSTAGGIDFGLLSILSQLFGQRSVTPSYVAVPSAPAASTASGTILGMKPEIAVLAGLGIAWILTQRR